MLARSNCSTPRPNTLMQHLTFVVLEVCLATRGRAIHCGTKRQFAALRHVRQKLGAKRKLSQTPSVVRPTTWSLFSDRNPAACDSHATECSCLSRRRANAGSFINPQQAL